MNGMEKNLAQWNMDSPRTWELYWH